MVASLLTACGSDSNGVQDDCADANPVAGGVCVTRVTGRIVDSSGEPPPDGSFVTVCGPTCFPGDADAEGEFLVDEIDNFLVLSEYSALLHGRPDFAGFYFPVPETAEGPEVELGDLTVFRMPEGGSLVPATTTEDTELESNGVTLSMPAGLVTQFDFDAIAIGEPEMSFRVLELSAEEAAPAVGDVEGALTFYAFGPFEATFTPVDGSPVDRVPMRLTFPNPTALEPGTQVEILALGSYLFANYVTPARFEAVATATVSEDGALIEMDAGQGLELLTWVAIRPAP